jgi:hypothetical protein
MSKRPRFETLPNDDVLPTPTITTSISKIIDDCKITPYHGGNNRTKLKIEFPDYFHSISPSVQQCIIDVISSISIEEPIIENLQK